MAQNSSQTQSKKDDEDTHSGNDIQDDGNANDGRVGITRNPSHKFVSKRKSLMSICIDNNIFSS